MRLLAAVTVVSTAACNSVLAIDEWQASGPASATSTSSGSGGGGDGGASSSTGGGQAGGGGEAGSGGAPSCPLSFTTSADVILSEEATCPSGTISYNDNVWATVSRTAFPTRHVLLRFTLDPDATRMLSQADQTPVTANVRLTRTSDCDGGCPGAQPGGLDVFVATSDWKEGSRAADDDGAMWCYSDGEQQIQWAGPGALGAEDSGPLLGSALVDTSSATVDIALAFQESMASWLATGSTGELSLLLVPQRGLVLSFATHESIMDPPTLAIDAACP